MQTKATNAPLCYFKGATRYQVPCPFFHFVNWHSKPRIQCERKVCANTKHNMLRISRVLLFCLMLLWFDSEFNVLQFAIVALNFMLAISFQIFKEFTLNVSNVQQRGYLITKQKVSTIDETSFPKWTLLPEASKACYELVKCECKRNCGTICKCKHFNLECTDLCQCGGQCPEIAN